MFLTKGYALVIGHVEPQIQRRNHRKYKLFRQISIQNHKQHELHHRLNLDVAGGSLFEVVRRVKTTLHVEEPLPSMSTDQVAPCMISKCLGRGSSSARTIIFATDSKKCPTNLSRCNSKNFACSQDCFSSIDHKYSVHEQSDNTVSILNF